MMKMFLRNTNRTTKQKAACSNSLLAKTCCLLILALLFISLSQQSTQAATGLKLYQYSTKKIFTYTGKQIKVNYKGIKISNDQTPGLVIKDVAMVPFYDIYSKSKIDADYIYNKTKGTLTITRTGKKIIMTLNSRKATVNGKTVYLSAAPVQYKFMDLNITKIYVPAKAVSSALGLEYSWSVDKSTIILDKKTLTLSYDGGSKFEYTGVQGQVNYNGKKMDLSEMPCIIVKGTIMAPVGPVFAGKPMDINYVLYKNTNTIVLENAPYSLSCQVGSKETEVLHKPYTLTVTPPMIVKNYDTGKSYVMVPAAFTSYATGKYYAWNVDKKTSYISSINYENELISSQPGYNPANTKIVPISLETPVPKTDREIILEAGGEFVNKHIDPMTYSYSSNVHDLIKDTASEEAPGTINGFHTIPYEYIQNSEDTDTQNRKNVETLQFTSDTPFGTVTSSYADKVLTLNANHMNFSIDAQQNTLWTQSKFVQTMNLSYNPESDNTSINLAMLPDNFTYDITLSEDQKTLSLSIYINALTGVAFKTDETCDTLILNGIAPLDVNIVRDDASNVLRITLPYTTNGVGYLASSIEGALVFDILSCSHDYENTKLALAAVDDVYYNYEMTTDGNQVVLKLYKLQ